MKVIGLTGGIATGKSTVSRFAMELGIPIIDADLIAREIVMPGKPALQEIVDAFGDEVLNDNEELNRKKLGSMVFGNKEELEKLNKITHPRIINEIINEIKFYRNTNRYSFIILDAALLIEMEMMNFVDEIWLVETDTDIQIKRIMDRDKLDKVEAIRRIESQMDIEKKEKYADIVIKNNGNIESLKNRIRLEIDRVKESSGGI